jgi:hypothetical protein
MPTNYTPTKFSIQQVFEVLIQNITTGAILGYLDDCKTSNLINEAQLVYPTGGRGNAYIGGAFGHSRRARIEIQKAAWNTDVVATQVGNTTVVGSNKNIVKYDIVEVTVADEVTTTFKALGTAGSEIGFVYILNADGSFGTVLTQAAAVAAGVFAYAPATKKITSNTGELPIGTKVACAYKFDAGTSAKTISIETDVFPPLVKATAFGIVKDLATGELYQMELLGQAQIDPNWNWDLASDGEPSVQNFNLEFTKSVLNNNLYDIVVYNEADAT